MLMVLTTIAFCSLAQDAGRTLKPNYRKIARVVATPASPYFLDSLDARYWRLDTSLTVDDLRCFYYGGGDDGLARAWQRYVMVASRMGRQSRQAGDAWMRYQWLTTAVWSTGDGGKRHPLHVTSVEDAQQAALGFEEVLWFKIKGKRKFSVAPRR